MLTQLGLCSRCFAVASVVLWCSPAADWCAQKKAGCVQLSLPDPPEGWTLLSLDLKVRPSLNCSPTHMLLLL
jgi:hypothetical protein